MPIYEYKCLECSAHVEKMQKLADAPLTVCEVCGGKLEKQWSLSGIQFKGAGWYVNDYSTKLKDPNAATADKSEKTTAGKAETSEKSDKPDKSEKSEKTSAAESTAKTGTASNKSNDAAPSSKTETAAKKD